LKNSEVKVSPAGQTPKNLSVADYLVSRLASDGVDTVFSVVGGGIMYLVDAIARSERVTLTACHHEEFAGISAIGYALTKKPYGVAFGTTGPGTTHLFTAVAAAWQDSVPTLFIAGQVKSQDSSSIQGLSLRQNGTFEFDSLESFRPITKRISIVKSAKEFQRELEISILTATSGRPGPVLIEIPLDIQNELFVPDKEHSSLGMETSSYNTDLQSVEISNLETSIALLSSQLSQSHRPLFLLGAGTLRSDCHERITSSLDSAGIPYVVTQFAREAGDLNHKLYLGSPGIKANRSANSAIAECDLLIAVGTSLHQQVIGWDQNEFIKLPSYKIWFEMDSAVVSSRSHLVDVAITLPTDKAATAIYNSMTDANISTRNSAWLERCSELRATQLLHFPMHQDDEESMCLYKATTALSEHSGEFSAACTDAGIVWYTMAQHYFPIASSFYISSGSFGSMGMALPYAIGAASATKKRVLALTGDGSIMMCLSELATLRETQLPVVLVINSNKGYRSIRATQDRYFEGRHLGTDEKSGLFIPNFKEVANAFELDYFEAKNLEQLNLALDKVIDLPSKPAIIEIYTFYDQAVEPLIESRVDASGKMISGGLGNMYPPMHVTR
jgi:acetolactate synthase I/II/III large subunit